MAVTLRADVVAAIREHGRDTYPNECCGALLGRDGVVVEAFALPNTTEEGPRRRFLVRPSDYRAAEARAARRGPELLGLLSLASRSSGAAVAVRPRSRVAVFSYVIVSVAEGRTGDITSWRLREDRSAFDRGACRTDLTECLISSLNERARHMPMKIHIPTPLRPFTDKLDVVEVDGQHRRRAAQPI